MQFSIHQLLEIKAIIGLGNMGEKYKLTRHNAGFLFLEKLRSQYPHQASKWEDHQKFKFFSCSLDFNSHKVMLVQPTTMMNSSGIAVMNLLNFYKLKPEEILIAHDDLDIDLGYAKVQFNKGPKIHNGINSIEHRIGTPKFWRLRIGVDARPEKGNKGISGHAYSLQKFYPDELTQLDKVFNQIISSTFLYGQVESVAQSSQSLLP